MPWDPGSYLAFGAERLRPALDLLARVPLAAPRRVVDLGCGAGQVTALLKARWPGAWVTGVDRSPSMLDEASRTHPSLHWQAGDLASWAPDEPVDLLFANASLHWVADHVHLFPRLLGLLSPGGYLAVQMPRNHDRPSHQAAYELAQEAPWRGRLGPELRRVPVHAPEGYLGWLDGAAACEVWETDYFHLLQGEDPVADWTRGSFLVPWLEALGPDLAPAFLDAYRARLREAYPRDGRGRTPFWFRRLFLVARAPGTQPPASGSDQPSPSSS